MLKQAVFFVNIGILEGVDRSDVQWAQMADIESLRGLDRVSVAQGLRLGSVWPQDHPPLSSTNPPIP